MVSEDSAADSKPTKMIFPFAREAQATMIGFLVGFALSTSPIQAATSNLSPQAEHIGAFITKVNPQLTPELRKHYASQTLEAAHAAKIDPCLLVAVVSVESHWKASAISRHGAIGLGQLKPTTAAFLHANPYSPQENLRATSQYLRQLIDRFGDQANKSVAIAAYNAGPTAVARNHNLPPSVSTAVYVRRVLNLWEQSRKELVSTEFITEAEQTQDIRYWGVQSAHLEEHATL